LLDFSGTGTPRGFPRDFQNVKLFLYLFVIYLIIICLLFNKKTPDY